MVAKAACGGSHIQDAYTSTSNTDVPQQVFHFSTLIILRKYFFTNGKCESLFI